MTEIDDLIADVRVLQNTVVAMLPLIADRPALLAAMDAGAQTLLDMVLSEPVPDEWLALLRRRLELMRSQVS